MRNEVSTDSTVLGKSPGYTYVGGAGTFAGNSALGIGVGVGAGVGVGVGVGAGVCAAGWSGADGAGELRVGDGFEGCGVGGGGGGGGAACIWVNSSENIQTLEQGLPQLGSPDQVPPNADPTPRSV